MNNRRKQMADGMLDGRMKAEGGFLREISRRSSVLAVVVEWRGPSVVVVSGRGLLRPSRRVVTRCDYTRASAVSQVVGLTS